MRGFWPIDSSLIAQRLQTRRPVVVKWLIVEWPDSVSPRLLPTNLSLLSRLLQLPIPLSMDLVLTPGEPVLRRDVADGTVQTDVVVMLDVARHQSPCIFQRQWRSRPDALSFERFVPAFDFSPGTGG